MNHKKNLFILFVCLLTCGCSSNPFGDYNYKNNDPISYNLKDFTNADGLIIDGKKENEYGEKIHAYPILPQNLSLEEISIIINNLENGCYDIDILDNIQDFQKKIKF